MHHCLQISEVLRAIFRSFQPYQGNFTLGDLSAAARTCKGFYEPASDVLWENLDDLTPLVKCLPPNLWYEEEEGGGSNLWSVVSIHSIIVSLHCELIISIHRNSIWSANSIFQNGKLSTNMHTVFGFWSQEMHGGLLAFSGDIAFQLRH